MKVGKGALLAGLCAAVFSGSVFAAVPRSKHVVIVMEENHSYEQVIGNPAMPYLNKLAAQYGLATAYYANSHYSIPNYMWITAGKAVTFHDNTTAKFDTDNIVRHLLTAGKTWKEYADGLPHAGYTGYNVGSYVERHNPFAYFTDVANSSERFNMVPMTQFTTDLQNHALPDFSFITPSLLHDGHNGTLAAADQWLQAKIKPLLATRTFQPGGDGILIITFDEGPDTDCRPNLFCAVMPGNVGGGRVVTVVVGPRVKRGYRSTRRYQHQNVLKTVGVALGLGSVPGAAKTASDLGEFFK